MDLVAVQSSNIAAVGYDGVQNILHVRFKGRPTVYKYHGVTLEEYQAMMSAESIGSYYARSIKNKYKSEAVASDPNARKYN